LAATLDSTGEVTVESHNSAPTFRLDTLQRDDEVSEPGTHRSMG
jgi:hypothetical protein